MTANTKQDKTTYLILNILSWLIVFAVVFAKNLFMIISGFIILTLVNLRMMALGKRLKSKNNQDNKK